MIHQITTQIAPITNHQFYIQAALILAVIAVGWMMLRTPGGARHQAARRLATLAFVVFAIVAIAFPSVMTAIAHRLGVGRGTDLLLFAMVPKHGPLIILGAIEGLILFVSGMYWGWSVACVVLAVLADLIAGLGGFRSRALAFCAFIVYSLAPMGSYLALWVDPAAYASYLTGKGGEQAYMDTMMATATGWMLPAMVLSTIACAVVSGLVGLRLLRRQFERAGITA